MMRPTARLLFKHPRVFTPSRALSTSFQTATNEDVIAHCDQYLAPYYADVIPIAVEKTQGPFITSVEGASYFDLNGGYGACRFGHNPSQVVSAAQAQMDKCSLPSRGYMNPMLGTLGEKLANIYKDVLKPRNGAVNPQIATKVGGGDACDYAIKLALKWGVDKKNIPDGELFGGHDLFHGRMISCLPPNMGDDAMSKGFAQTGMGFPHKVLSVFNSIEDIEKIFKTHGDKIAGCMGEYVLGEAGVRIANPEYLQRMRELCDETNTLMIADDVQTFASTGNYSPSQHPVFEGYNVKPDVVVIAKALTSGVTPGSVIIADREVQGVMGPGTDGSTFGGNPVMCAASLATLNMIETDKLFDELDVIGGKIRGTMLAAQKKNPSIVDVRGLGAMLAVEFDTEANATKAKYALASVGVGLSADESEISGLRVDGVRLKATRGNILRVSPTLMSDEEV
eukprot:CAMPEP_0181292332 /NCGR_PEP_ID=MMETSP1101-20121128/2451_1 /TAXON_ID=46948 /ORGANISM="Rhodomonas abbreviata, Strain Caron Lab Isolate" /LENGTH=451 /DNA_ID=CAMNT_0023396797 /DNA_START=22 /DNA_END=1374 /DNA_ORIENTATION=-